MDLPVYLDYNATTPVAPGVAEAIEPFLRTGFGNPSSDHLYGRQARQAVDRARAQVAALIGAKAAEVIFTGCATEANTTSHNGRWYCSPHCRQVEEEESLREGRTF